MFGGLRFLLDYSPPLGTEIPYDSSYCYFGKGGGSL